MLCSLSGYQYTRKAWKKDVFDLLMDQNFFQMDELCISHWHGIIDNLMTHDKTTFKDLLGISIIYLFHIPYLLQSTYFLLSPTQ